MWVEIGNQLRQARESSGLSFKEIQEKTQIDTVSLNALESGDFDKIGSAFTVRSYIRAYAKQVGLEPTYLLKRYRPDQTGMMQAVDLQGTAQYHLAALNSDNVQETDSFKTLPTTPPSNDDEYDPFKNHPDRQYDNQEEAYDPYASMSSHSDEKVPSRSTGKRQSLSRDSGLQLPAKKSNTGKFPPIETDPTRSDRYSEQGTSESSRSSRIRRGGYDHEPIPDTGWEGYQETAASEEEISGWNSIEPLSRSDRNSTLSRRSSTTMPSVGEGGWDEMSTLSRSRSGRERAVPPSEPIANPPALLNHANDQRGLSRSGRRKQVVDRGKKAGMWIAQKKWTYVAIAVAILLIPMSVLAYNSIKEPSDSEASANPDQNNTVNSTGTETGDASQEGKASVVTVNQSSTLGEYKLSQPDTIAIKFKALGNGSWIQIREEQNPDAPYIKDFTLQPGEEFPYNHAQNASNDVWITIGQPENVAITINGQDVETVKSVHVARE
ncbi:helix-turn-helix domain-containing protein [Desmospora activa]|uniref:Helix-turn-helix protein n=1 Tax=Desmospora activa DSM 45169 TaxID=1121389 RepID=A0A2T4Z3P4_9BACL|nr:helix-turn-helix domain-containing protein [Desmospora activa]PTM56513.1 helix-turn-helix protein [Desmospora activa DSM 45169]